MPSSPTVVSTSSGTSARAVHRGLGVAGFVALVLLWEVAIRRAETHLLPTPLEVLRALGELALNGKLARHVVASLYRVTWGYLLAVMLAVPLGVYLGFSPRGERATGPLLQIFRPISPLAWIPLAILWFGVGDLSAVFIIFVACFGPLTVSTLNAVRKVPAVHLNAGRNFGLSNGSLLTRVVLPSALPQLVVGIRQTLYVAWTVVVMAEMVAVSSGLGFLIVDSRNAGNRYDLVVAGMVIIGLIGLLLETALRRLERLPALRWGFSQAAPSADLVLPRPRQKAR